MNLKNTLIAFLQTLLPHHILSQIVSRFTHCEQVYWKNFLIRQIATRYNVVWEESITQDLQAFKSFNAFFTRELKAGIRPLSHEVGLISSPADGVISQVGTIVQGDIFQAKGKNFTVTDLLGGDISLAERFNNGSFATIYLSPKDYHRLHMPITGTLSEMIHVPGRLFSVNSATTEAVPRLFARNERVIAIFNTEIGHIALVLVGAIFVSSIETVWHGVVTPPTLKTIQRWNYKEQNAPTLKIGEEMGRFNMGSTIIVLFEKNKMKWNDDMLAGKIVKLNEKIGKKI